MTNYNLNKAIDFDKEHIVLPMPPDAKAREDMDVYARFMRHLRHVPCSRPTIKVLSSIQFTADLMNYNDAHIAKILVEQGLRAPRAAFPSEFLRFVDNAMRRVEWEVGAPGASVKELAEHWAQCGESVFAAYSGEYDLAFLLAPSV